jgi:hypothetical protein
LSEGHRGSLAPSLKLPTRQFFNARPPWGKMKGGKNQKENLKIVTEIVKYNTTIRAGEFF